MELVLGTQSLSMLHRSTKVVSSSDYRCERCTWEWDPGMQVGLKWLDSCLFVQRCHVQWNLISLYFRCCQAFQYNSLGEISKYSIWMLISPALGSREERKQRGGLPCTLSVGKHYFVSDWELRLLPGHANRKVLICQLHAVSLGTDVWNPERILRWTYC